MTQKEHLRTNDEGTILGFPGPAFAIIYLIVIAAFVILAIWVIGDPNPRG